MKSLNTTSSLLAGTLLAAAWLLLAACGGPPTDPEAQRSGQVDSRGTTADPAAIARQLVADLLSLPVAEITLVSSEAKNFADASLDCPAPGMSYAQVITPGHRIIVEADGRRFDVRVSGTFGKICRNPPGKERPDKPDSSAPEHASPITSQVDNARSDLARLLGLRESEIRVVDVRRFTPGSGAPGCEPECEADDGSCGYLIGLYHDGRRYEYHAIQGQATPCPPLLPI